MKRVYAYETFDGMVFRTWAEAEAHEQGNRIRKFVRGFYFKGIDAEGIAEALIDSGFRVPVEEDEDD